LEMILLLVNGAVKFLLLPAALWPLETASILSV